jgi:hypothetical protein
MREIRHFVISHIIYISTQGGITQPMTFEIKKVVNVCLFVVSCMFDCLSLYKLDHRTLESSVSTIWTAVARNNNNLQCHI